MSQARALSAEEIRGLRDELAGGGTPTVWFTASAVGVPEGRSGKVIALDEPAEGDFIQVRPAGSKDVLSFSAGEVTLVKPPRKRKEPERAGSGSGSAAPGAASSGAAAGSAGSAASGPAAPGSGSGAKSPSPASAGTGATASAAARKPAKTADAKEPKVTGSGSEGKGTAAKSAGSAGAASQGAGSTGGAAPKSAPARRKPRSPAGATVVLTADDAGQWSCEVSNGKKRVLRPTPVTASAVAQATRALHEDVAAAVEPLLDAAREQQRERVERLQQELAAAQRMLDELTD